jgi:membrane fusion protein, heavy metal efflux system
MNPHEASADTQLSPHPPRGTFIRHLGQSLVALGLVALGALGATLLPRQTGSLPPVPVTAAPPPSPAASQAVPTPDTEVELMLTPEAVQQAGIKTAEVTTAASQTTVQLPGSVMADAYREVQVVPIAGGIVTQVHVELGTVVKRGAPLATVFSTELAEAQTKYLSMQAMLAADHQKLERTRQLVAIGAASRQELEEVTAVHASRATEVEAARQRLLLLGLHRSHVEALNSPRQVVSKIMVPAPISGVITGRTANLGQVVGMGQELFVVTDLSQVWAIGDLYEQDFQAVRVGSEAAITTPAYPGMALRGRVTYIDPRVDPQTRTAKVRVEVANPEGRLRLGMYVTMAFTTRGGARQVVVPSTAIQAIGERSVVFLPVAEEEGTFVQRTVQVGPSHDGLSTILNGLQPGETVVTEGSFLLRAELLRNAPASS